MNLDPESVLDVGDERISAQDFRTNILPRSPLVGFEDAMSIAT